MAARGRSGGHLLAALLAATAGAERMKSEQLGAQEEGRPSAAGSAAPPPVQRPSLLQLNSSLGAGDLDVMVVTYNMGNNGFVHNDERLTNLVRAMQVNPENIEDNVAIQAPHAIVFCEQESKGDSIGKRLYEDSLIPHGLYYVPLREGYKMYSMTKPLEGVNHQAMSLMVRYQNGAYGVDEVTLRRSHSLSGKGGTVLRFTMKGIAVAVGCAHLDASSKEQRNSDAKMFTDYLQAHEKDLDLAIIAGDLNYRASNTVLTATRREELVELLGTPEGCAQIFSADLLNMGYESGGGQPFAPDWMNEMNENGNPLTDGQFLCNEPGNPGDMYGPTYKLSTKDTTPLFCGLPFPRSREQIEYCYDIVEDKGNKLHIKNGDEHPIGYLDRLCFKNVRRLGPQAKIVFQRAAENVRGSDHVPVIFQLSTEFKDEPKLTVEEIAEMIHQIEGYKGGPLDLQEQKELIAKFLLKQAKQIVRGNLVK